MTVTVYRSTDAGAPTISGVQGSIINALTACLVTGYGTKPAAGWTKPFTGTYAAAFRQPATANQRYLYVDESVADNYARFTGYENMTAISSGTGIFPIPYYPSIMLYRSTSGSGDATPQPWMIVATDKIFYLWTSANGLIGASATYAYGLAFGDFISLLPNDAYNTILIGPTSYSSGALQTIADSGVTTAGLSGHYVPRNYTQLGGAIEVVKTSDWSKIGGTVMGAQGAPFPNPTDGKIYVAPIQIVESVSATVGITRGILPGIWAPCFRAISVLNDGDILDNISGITNKTLEAKFLASANNSAGACLFETSNTW